MKRLSASVYERLSTPLPQNDIHERLQVIETERDAVVPGTGLILERAGKGRPEERARGTIHRNGQTGIGEGADDGQARNDEGIAGDSDLVQP